MTLSALRPSRLLSLDRHGNPIREAWDRLHGVPGGKRLFAKLVGRAAPYTGTMGAQVAELRLGFARTVMADRKAVRNHLRSVHAIALCNLAELTGNIALAYSLPDDARFIVAGIDIDYLKKARGRVTGECHCPVPASSERRSYELGVELRDPAGDVVARATLRSLVGPKPAG